MKVLTAQQIQEVSGGLTDSQLSYALTLSTQVVGNILFKGMLSDAGLSNFVRDVVVYPIFNVVAMVVGNELGNYYIERFRKKEAVAKAG